MQLLREDLVARTRLDDLLHDRVAGCVRPSGSLLALAQLRLLATSARLGYLSVDGRTPKVLGGSYEEETRVQLARDVSVERARAMR